MYIPPFNITSKIMSLVSEISEQVGIVITRLGNNAPSPQLRKKNQIKTIHSSLAIEQNTLSLKQVTDIIDGKHVLGAPDEIQEVKITEVQDKVQDKMQDKFPEVPQAVWNVLDIIQHNPKVRAIDICEIMNLKERQVYKHLSLLKSLGLIVRIGSNKTGYWKIMTEQ